MWLFLTRRLRTWLLITLLLPLATGLLRRIGETLQRRNGPSSLSNGLLKAGALGDQARARLRGRPVRA
jgi:formate hydrogenlyase subunit 4